MNHSSPFRLFSMVMLGLLLGLLPQDALLLSPDSAALSSLAKQLGKDPAGDACSWEGITCDHEASRVVGISLDNYGLTGTLPEAWGQLSKISNLDLGTNKLTGPLPDSWKTWTNISSLVLSDNQLTGPIPDSWKTWINMGDSDLSRNNLTGPLPDSWKMWTNISSLDLSYNQLTGPLPDSWKMWTNIGNLDLSTNNLTGPLPDSWKTWNINSLDLGYNQLTGPLPDSWNTWTNMGSFDLSYNNFTGPLPDSWQTWIWTNLADYPGSFDLSNNHLTGLLPDSWQTWTNMATTFDLSYNELTGRLPDSWRMWTRLNNMDLGMNNLTGTLPQNLTQQLLSLEGNKLTGTLPDAWQSLTQLKYLSLQGNCLNGSLPAAWGASLMPTLVYMDLGENMLSGSLPQAWSDMTNLEYISLAQNVFSGSMPSTWINSTVVQYVNFGSNHLSSSIPKLAAGLQLLDMSSNGISKLSYKLLPHSLEVLRLGNNKLAGAFPDVSLLPPNLTILDLSYNLLTGSLPLAMPSKLTVLNATHNHMSGNLPDAWDVPLAEARLGSNKFVGKLPTSWSQYGRSTGNSLQLSILDTEIRGPMPQQWVQQFCLAIVRNSSSQVLFSPRTIVIPTSDFHDISVALGSPITLAAQHASINVTLSGDEYTFDYQSPGSLCSIPHAQRNAAIFWGVFGATFVGAIAGITLWLRRQVTSPMNKKFTILAYASSAVNHKKARVPKRIAAILWFCLTDIVWTLYSQVTDAITIHQVFGSGQMLYAYLLLAILLLPFLCIFFMVAIISIRHCLSSTFGQQYASIPLYRIAHNLAAIGVGVLFAPVLFIVLEAAMLTEGFGFNIAESLVPTAVELSSFYRAHAVAEAFLNALPQAVVQTKLYLMGNDPNGIHVYINTTLFFYSVAGSAFSVLKTVLLMIIELYQFRCSLVKYLRKLMVFENLDDQGTLVNGQQAGSTVGKTSSGTVLLPQSSVQSVILQRP
ncbi:hypothetical protein ABBQ38_014122 [Trebouxia sp. C0009 RCD-2024]